MKFDIEHVSLDFWNTVGMSNKAYTEARERYLRDVILNATSASMTTEQVRAAYLATKQAFDQAATLHGLAATPKMCIESFCANLGYPVAGTWNFPLGEVVDKIAKELAVLFRDAPPIHDAKLVDIINNYPVPVSIGSNTNFIGGELIQEWCEQAGFRFAFYIFSDQVGCSKPSIEFFNRVINKACVDPVDLLHIGDNQVCDQAGPWRSGCQGYLLESPFQLTQVLSHFRDPDQYTLP